VRRVRVVALAGAVAVTGMAWNVAVSPSAVAAKAAHHTVSVANNPELGRILVGPNGHTLYVFENDKAAASACTSGCATIWPALSASGTPTAGVGVMHAKLHIANGQVPRRMIYNGHLLYFFSGDMKPGQTMGTKVSHWYAVRPNGLRLRPGGAELRFRRRVVPEHRVDSPPRYTIRRSSAERWRVSSCPTAAIRRE
jgi:predicted lipoprotein with Yx(FWY)xxD motif